jgi:hypothetical protein
MPSDPPAGAVVVADVLRQILGMTQTVLAGVVTADDVEQLLVKRKPLVDRVLAAKGAGESWGTAEQQLAEQIVAVDQQMVTSLWQPRADAFKWLSKRSPDVVDQLPTLRKLVANDGGS